MPLVRSIELVGDDDVSRGDGLFQAADGRDGDDPLHAELLHAVDVGAVVDFRRQVAVSATVAGQKYHADAVQHAGDVFVGRITERGVHADPLHLLKPFHIIEAASADNSDGCSGLTCLFPFPQALQQCLKVRQLYGFWRVNFNSFFPADRAWSGL